MNNTGFLLINTIHGTRYVHRLLAEAFIPLDGDPDEHKVIHLDGNKLNNAIENLAWRKKRNRADDELAILTERIVQSLTYHPDRRKKAQLVLNRIRSIQMV